MKPLRPLLVDSLNGGSTDGLQKAPVEKKNWPKIGKVLKCHIRPTERYDPLKWGGMYHFFIGTIIVVFVLQFRTNFGHVCS